MVEHGSNGRYVPIRHYHAKFSYLYRSNSRVNPRAHSAHRGVFRNVHRGPYNVLFCCLVLFLYLYFVGGGITIVVRCLNVGAQFIVFSLVYGYNVDYDGFRIYRALYRASREGSGISIHVNGHKGSRIFYVFVSRVRAGVLGYFCDRGVSKFYGYFPSTYGASRYV